MNVSPSTRPAAHDDGVHAPEERTAHGAADVLLAGQFQQALAQAAWQRRARREQCPGDEPTASAQPQVHAVAAAAAAPVDAAAAAPGLSALEFAAALERLHAPLESAAGARWNFGLDPSCAPLAALNIAAAERGGWTLSLVPSARQKPVLQAHLDALRLRLDRRGAAVLSLSVDDTEH